MSVANPTDESPAFLPNFFIAGAPKAGTSSVHQWLADHPEIVGSREKETYFFVDPGTHMHRPEAHVSQGFASWQSQFDLPEGGAPPRVIVESTPAYLYSRTALEHIPALATEPKVLFILREPAEQIRSLHSYFRNNWSWIPADMDFAAYLAAVRSGSHDFGGNEIAANAIDYARYARWLDPWRAALGEGRMRVRGFSDLVRDEVGFMKDLAAWLGVDPAFYDSYTFPRENETYAPRSRAVQRINLAVRGRLPKGRLYNAARALYRRLNTTPRGAAASESDAAVVDALRAEFAADNAALAARYGVTFEPGR